MKKICLALAGSAFVLATPAMASTVLVTGFSNYGDCNSMLHWLTNSARKGSTQAMTAETAQLVSGGLVCVQTSSGWQIETA